LNVCGAAVAGFTGAQQFNNLFVVLIDRVIEDGGVKFQHPGSVNRNSNKRHRELEGETKCHCRLYKILNHCQLETRNKEH
jgi:hypothetical protein